MLQVAEVGIPWFSWKAAHIQCQERIRDGEKDVPGECGTAADCSACGMVLRVEQEQKEEHILPERPASAVYGRIL